MLLSFALLVFCTFETCTFVHFSKQTYCYISRWIINCISNAWSETPTFIGLVNYQFIPCFFFVWLCRWCSVALTTILITNNTRLKYLPISKYIQELNASKVEDILLIHRWNLHQIAIFLMRFWYFSTTKKLVEAACCIIDF